MCFAGVGGARPTVVYRPTPITTRHGPTRKRVVQLYRLLRSCTTSKSPLSTRRCPHLLLSAGACCTAPAAALSDSFGCIGAINKFIYLSVYLSISCRSITPARRALSSKPADAVVAVDRRDGQTDRRMNRRTAVTTCEKMWRHPQNRKYITASQRRQNRTEPPRP